MLSCAQLPENTQICFLDDQDHDEMKRDNVVYINIEPYFYNYSFKHMALRYYKAFSDVILKYNKSASRLRFVDYIIRHTRHINLHSLNKSKVEKHIDYLLSKRIAKEIDEFFEPNMRDKPKSKKNPKKKTQKRKKKHKAQPRQQQKPRTAKR